MLSTAVGTAGSLQMAVFFPTRCATPTLLWSLRLRARSAPGSRARRSSLTKLLRRLISISGTKRRAWPSIRGTPSSRSSTPTAVSMRTCTQSRLFLQSPMPRAILFIGIEPAASSTASSPGRARTTTGSPSTTMKTGIHRTILIRTIPPIHSSHTVWLPVTVSSGQGL